MYRKTIAIGLFLASLFLMFSIPYIKNPFSTNDYYGHVVNFPAPDFDLLDLNDKTIDLKSFRGSYVYLMFGFLNCTETCHSQTLIMEHLRDTIPDKNLHFVYISMDPVRDDAENLKQYFKNRNSKLTVLRGHSLRQVQSVASQFRAPFSFTQSLGSDNIEIKHPGYIFLINPLGQLTLVYSGTVIEIDRLQQDYIQYKAHYS